MADYHVKTTAAGGGDGSSGNPWTLQEAFDNAVAGDRVFIWDGTYTLSATVDIDTNAGTAASPIQFIGANSSGVEDGTRPVITTSSTLANGLFSDGGSDTPYVQFRHLDFNGGGTSKAAYCVNTSPAPSSDYWTFIDCLFHDATSHGFYSRNVVVFHRCQFYDNGGDGYGIYSTGGSAAKFFACRIYDNTGDGVECGADGMTFVHCEVFGNGGRGISYDTGSGNPNVLFLWNTIYDNGSDGIYVNSAVKNVQIIANIIANNGGYGVEFSGSWSGGVFEWNILNGNTSGGCNITPPGNYYGLTTAPSFESVTAGSEDFTPTDGSNADGAGPSPSSNTLVDIGASRAEEPAGGGGGGPLVGGRLVQ